MTDPTLAAMDLAASFIKEQQERIEELTEALKECQSALAMLTEPREIRTTTVHQAWGIAVAAEAKARAILNKEKRS